METLEFLIEIDAPKTKFGKHYGMMNPIKNGHQYSVIRRTL